MNSVLGTFRLGADATIMLDAVEGDPAVLSSIAAVMRPMIGQFPALRWAAEGQAVNLAIAPRPAGDGYPQGWTITVPSAVTAQLAEGLYGIDVRMETPGGTVDITQSTAVIRFTRPASL